MRPAAFQSTHQITGTFTPGDRCSVLLSSHISLLTKIIFLWKITVFNMKVVEGVSCELQRQTRRHEEDRISFRRPVDEVCDVLRIYVSTQPCILGAQRQVWRDGVSCCCSSAAQNWNLATLCKSSPKPVWTIKKQKENSASETHFTSFLCSQKVFKLSLCVFHVWNRGETKFDFIFLLFETERQKIKVEENQSKMFLFCEDNNQSCCSGNIFAAEWSFY